MCVSNLTITSSFMMPKLAFNVDLIDERQYKIVKTHQGTEVLSIGEFLSPVKDHQDDFKEEANHSREQDGKIAVVHRVD